MRPPARVPDSVQQLRLDGGETSEAPEPESPVPAPIPTDPDPAADGAGRIRPAARAAGGIMAQYRRIKAEHPDSFLFFRLGDFYEMFFDDAVRGAALLGLTLTSRNKHDPEPVPMCGVPWHQRDAYIGRLLRLGHKVAVCDQLEDASAAKGLVQRGVTEVMTPGSVMADGFVEPAANNFLAALWPESGVLGVCLADATTGEIKLAETGWSEAAALLARLSVAEWLIPAGDGLEPGTRERLDTVRRGLPGAVTPAPVAGFLTARPPAREGPGAEEMARAAVDLPAAARAAGAALAYLERVQGGPPRQLARVERWNEDAALRVDAATTRHLELFQPMAGGEPRHTLWHHLNLCVTAPGARRLRGWLERPLAELEPLLRRQDAVAAWVTTGAARAGLREALRGLPDLERLAARVACARATPRDLGALRDTLARLPGIAARLAASGVAGNGARAEALAGIPELERMLTDALVDEPPALARDGGIIRTGWDELRDGLEDAARSGKRWILELEAAERARTGIASLKIGYNRVFGYYLEITRAHLDKVPADYERRQTLTAAERYVTPELKRVEGEVLGAEERLLAREQDLFTELRARAAEHLAALQRAADALAGLDAESSLAEAAARHGWTRPRLEPTSRLVLEGARHPVVERLLPPGAFVPNDCALDGDARQILLLTGPNMGGKSTYLRQIALIVLLAQAGSFVPAARAEIGLVDRLFTRVGASDRLGAGESTFMVEMRETAEILRGATSRSLVLLDELGRGTATYDGLALAWAVTEHLHEDGGPRPRTVFATHYHELTQLAGFLPRLANVHAAVREHGEDVVFLHRIAEGAADRSYGIHVAQRAGLPATVLARARVVLAELERERTVEHLEGTTAAPAGSTGPRSFDPVDLLAEALRQLELDRVTPLEALQLLTSWKRALAERIATAPPGDGSAI